MSDTKIFSLQELQTLLESKYQGKKIILCHGCFDLLHIGHIRYLKKARALGDLLVVTLTADQHVNKGPGRPVFPEELRAEHMAALDMVDFVAINHAKTALNVIKSIKPTFYVKGNEYEKEETDITGNITLERLETEKYGGQIYYTDEITFSSSKLLNENFSVFSPETKSFLQNFRQRYDIDQILEQLEGLKSLRIAVVGDCIIDEYHYTEPLGQTGKGNVFAVNYKSSEKFAGGAIAVANHIAGFVKEVTLFSGLGKKDSQEEYIREKLVKNVNPEFVYFENAPTIVKRRYIDEGAGTSKLFEVYFYHEDACSEITEKKAVSWLSRNLPTFDAVIVPDFGNGFIVGDMIETISSCSKFVAVNTQINSGNRGYHVITRYPKANFISLNEPEIRLAAHDRHSTLQSVATKISQQLDADQVAITRGIKGAAMLDTHSGINSYYETPALSTKVVDRIGAGDTFLALAGICLAKKIPPELSLFVASSAAALDVQIVCNREPIEPSSLFRYINTLLK